MLIPLEKAHNRFELRQKNASPHTKQTSEQASKRAGKLTIELSELKKKKTNERVNGLKVNAVTSFIDARKTTKKKERKKESMPCVD